MRLAQVLLAAVVAGLTAVTASLAYFEAHDDQAIRVTTDRPERWLHLHSQSNDPEGRMGYAKRGPEYGVPAAEGGDRELVVRLGRRAPLAPGQPDDGTWPKVEGAFTVVAAETFPDEDIRELEVSLRADSPMLGQPRLVRSNGEDPVTTVRLRPGQRRRIDLRPLTDGLPARSRQTGHLTLALGFIGTDGADGSVMRYRVPVRLCTATRALDCGPPE